MPRNVFEIKDDEDESLDDARFAAALDDAGLDEPPATGERPGAGERPYDPESSGADHQDLRPEPGAGGPDSNERRRLRPRPPSGRDPRPSLRERAGAALRDLRAAHEERRARSLERDVARTERHPRAATQRDRRKGLLAVVALALVFGFAALTVLGDGEGAPAGGRDQAAVAHERALKRALRRERRARARAGERARARGRDGARRRPPRPHTAYRPPPAPGPAPAPVQQVIPRPLPAEPTVTLPAPAPAYRPRGVRPAPRGGEFTFER
jgi:hypothetical protein